jgi:hypothetical protein
MNLRIITAIFALLPALSAGPMAYPPQEPDLETNLKAAFLYNFTKYVEWPPDNESQFTIGIVGPSDLEGALREIAKTTTADNKTIVIRRFDKPEDIIACQVLFISHRSRISLPEILAKTEKGELTVAEQPDAARKGTIFNFVRIDDKLKFEVNIKALSFSGLRISSQLLKLAIVVSK